MNDRDFWLGTLAITAIVLGIFFGVYKAGRFVERRELTRYFVKMTSETYYEAYQDGFTAGALYEHKKAKPCPTLEDEDGRY